MPAHAIVPKPMKRRVRGCKFVNALIQVSILERRMKRLMIGRSWGEVRRGWKGTGVLQETHDRWRWSDYHR